MFIEIGISTQFEGWNPLEKEVCRLLDSAVHAAVEHCCHYPQISERSAEISIVLCDDAFIRDLNKNYRGKDKATNVLSFPQSDFNDFIPPQGILAFGDIILSYQTIEREAAVQDKTFADHFTHMVVHGTLHLLGYDHEKEAEAEEMEGLEIAILQKMGIENPYSELNFMTA